MFEILAYVFISYYGLLKSVNPVFTEPKLPMLLCLFNKKHANMQCKVLYECRLFNIHFGED